MHQSSLYACVVAYTYFNIKDAKDLTAPSFTSREDNSGVRR